MYLQTLLTYPVWILCRLIVLHDGRQRQSAIDFGKNELEYDRPAKVHRSTVHTRVGLSPSPESRNNVGNLASGTSDPSPRAHSSKLPRTQTVSAEKGLDRETALNTGIMIITITTATIIIMRSLLQNSSEGPLLQRVSPAPV